jgi:diguanylate cyclase (GGDEF)-like protein
MQCLLPGIKPLSIWAYIVSLTLWLALCMGVAATVVTLNIRDVEKDLTQYGDVYSDHLNKELVSSETVLKGFSALFSAIGSTDPAKATRYVNHVIETNPHIFALEIVQKVPHGQLADFVARKRREGLAGFSVRSFSYDADRIWQAAEAKPYYYPIVFMEPMPPTLKEVLGMDVDSVPFLKRAMTESLKRGTPVASHPFRLVEGNLAYVVFCPIERGTRGDGRPPADELIVDMVIDAARLTQPVKLPVFDGGTVRVYHRDFEPDDVRGQLRAIAGQSRSPVEVALFPDFVYTRPLATMGEPFVLQVRRQVGWSDLNLGLLGLLAAITLLSSLMLIAYLWTHQQSRAQQIENEKRLWHLANHDILTGLPNRMLLLDRMEQLLARMRRQEKRLAVMFLDIDGFKQVNDTYGHAAGDQLLRIVAERLQAAVRVDDTVARMSGDEFIVLIESVESAEALEAVKQKIQQKLAEGFQLDGQLIRVCASSGIALFPDDGDTSEALIKQADLRMYADKQSRRASARQV